MAVDFEDGMDRREEHAVEGEWQDGG